MRVQICSFVFRRSCCCRRCLSSLLNSRSRQENLSLRNSSQIYQIADADCDCYICWPFQLRHGSSPYLDTMSVMKLPLENYSGKLKFWISVMESFHNRLNETDSWIMSRTHKELLKAMSKFTYQSIIEDKEADISSMMHFISSHDRAGMITHPDPSKLHVCYFTVFIRSL